MAPRTSPGGKPVIEVPGLKPRSPVRTEAPVLVTVEPPRTAKLPAVPRPTGPGEAAPAGAPEKKPAMTRNTNMGRYRMGRMENKAYSRVCSVRHASPGA